MVLPLHLAKNAVHAALDMPELLFEDEGGEKVTLIIPYFIRFVKLNFGIPSSLPVNAPKPRANRRVMEFLWDRRGTNRASR